MPSHRLVRLLAAGLVAGLFALAGAGPQAAPLKVLHHFNGHDGTAPTGMVLASDGHFYGATSTGGDRSGCLPPDGCGTLFRLDATGQLQRLHVFKARDGYYPSGLVEGPDGRLYGAARLGGRQDGGGGGVLFSLWPTGEDFRIHHRFGDGSVCCDGARPQPGMLLASDGKLYGTTELGGDYRDVDHLGFGTVFSLDPATHEITYLHSFQLADGNGIFPNGYLLQANDGALYGTTREGGSAGGGTMWKIGTDGSGFQVVAQLPNRQTHSGPIQAQDGALYATDDIGAGSVFQVKDGLVSDLNRFDGADGKGLFFPVTRTAAGHLYGTAEHGGLLDPQGGDVFRLAPNGDLRVLHSFDPDVPNGIIPNARLIEGADGKLYGTAALGGKKGRGTIFRIDPDDLGSLQAISAPVQMQSGTRASGEVSLFKPAPGGGTVVTLSAGFGAITVPPTVTVPEGQTRAKFRIDSMKIGAPATIRIYASVQGQGTRAVVIVNP
ncbi:choice-of-anchor tandem repeat GloVer-containing protein [Ideonella sp. YS5]|uniref:choice-of-anchor tandem repeat GloVer-containing protein n=1 Tax=Ideonella sp. YS5 TaxID=3453714 RepID=UPI003EEC8E8A